MNNNLSDIVLKMTNIEGRRVYGENWENLDAITLEAYIGILLLAGVYRSHGESTKSLWNLETGRPIFSATLSLKFSVASLVCYVSTTSPIDGREEQMTN